MTFPVTRRPAGLRFDTLDALLCLVGLLALGAARAASWAGGTLPWS